MTVGLTGAVDLEMLDRAKGMLETVEVVEAAGEPWVAEAAGRPSVEEVKEETDEAALAVEVALLQTTLSGTATPAL